MQWKGIDYDTHAVHLVKDGGQQHSDAHRDLNPMREVPVLLVDDEPLGQSMAILEYLEERYPSPPLLPQGALERARVRQMAEAINSGIQPIQNLRVMQRLGKDFALSREQQQDWSRGWIEFGFDALHTLVSKHGGRYSFGDSPSFADLCLVPQLYNARRFQVDLTRYPKLLAVEEALETLPAFQCAHPDVQADAVLT